jgi:hypothetical protein
MARLQTFRAIAVTAGLLTYSDIGAAQQGWEQRAAQLPQYENRPETTIAADDRRRLIQWAIEAEDAGDLALATGIPLGEAYGDYYIRLILLLCRLHDPAAIPALARAVDVANRVATTLAEFGDPAVEPVIRVLGKPQLTVDAVYTLGKFVEGSTLGKTRLSPAMRSRIRTEVLKAVNHVSPWVRRAAVRALSNFDGDPEVITTLERVTSSDPYRRVREGGIDFPVRDEATKVLQRLRR